MPASLSGKEGPLSKGKDPQLAELRERLRHSCSHVMADAVRHFFPEVKLAIGPPTDDGFYYDFDLPRGLTPEDLQRIEEKMREIVAKDLSFQYQEVTREEAKRLFVQQPYKLELIESIPPEEKLSIYRHGEFVDLCEGPHVARTGQIHAFKLLNVAGAYWRGDEHNPMLQRIYGTAFESQEALEEHLRRLEEAQKRDHRKLGRELELFIFDPLAPASPFFLPNGAIIYNTLIEYIRGLYRQQGYQEVITPQIFSTDLWKRSGHYDNYIENMYMLEVEEREFGVKPMNCPSHALIYASQLRSYRDLPLRIADFGRLHRYERSGVTHGLTRVRTFTQDDAHIFCAPEHINEETRMFLETLMDTYRMLRFQDIRICLSLRPPKRIGTDEMWDQAEAALAQALKNLGIDYESQPGEGAFYGPKIDFFVADALGREWQVGTFQLDYNLGQRFGLEYSAADGSRKTPVVLHRAWFGSIERMFGILIEHFGGAFPVWLSPVQAMVIPIADRHLEYAQTVAGELRQADLRVKVDDRTERMQAKIRDAQMRKVPYMLIVGDRESKQHQAAVRLRNGQDLGARDISEVRALLLEAVQKKE